jgi:hypothetical protein
VSLEVSEARSGRAPDQESFLWPSRRTRYLDRARDITREVRELVRLQLDNRTASSRSRLFIQHRQKRREQCGARYTSVASLFSRLRYSRASVGNLGQGEHDSGIKPNSIPG